MTTRGKWATIVIVVGFVALLLWSTLSSQKAECTVTMAFQGQQATATASAASEADAIEQAKSTACGPISSGMNDRVACSNQPPVTKHCRTL